MNRYGITVDRTGSETEQIAQLRAEHLRQYPSIVMKNPDFAHLRDFILSHPLNQTDVMREAPDKVKVLNVMKDSPGFEYAQTVLNSYVIGYNSFTLEPRDFVKWLVTEFPRNFDWSFRQCKNPTVGEYMAGQMSWMSAPFAAADRSSFRFDFSSADAISNKTRAYCVINGIAEFPKCATCGKALVANVKSVFEGFRRHCDGSCAASDPSVQAKTGETCLANFGSETYLGSAEGVETKKRRLNETYGMDHYSGTDEWRAKVRAKSMRDYGVEWPSQNPETRKKASESLKIAAKEYTVRTGRTQRARRGGKFWTDDERKRISEANKSPENQTKRLERARKRHIRYYGERTKDLLRTYMSGEFKSLEFEDGRISVDRSKFCKAVSILGYRLVGETPPETVERKGLECVGQNVYKVPDCGKLIYEKD